MLASRLGSAKQTSPLGSVKEPTRGGGGANTGGRDSEVSQDVLKGAAALISDGRPDLSGDNRRKFSRTVIFVGNRRKMIPGSGRPRRPLSARQRPRQRRPRPATAHACSCSRVRFPDDSRVVFSCSFLSPFLNFSYPMESVVMVTQRGILGTLMILLLPSTRLA